MSEWVSVNDRCPTEEGLYIVYMRNDLWSELCRYEVTTNWWIEDRGFYRWDEGGEFVSHWMLLPEPPKGEDNEAM